MNTPFHHHRNLGPSPSDNAYINETHWIAGMIDSRITHSYLVCPILIFERNAEAKIQS